MSTIGSLFSGIGGLELGLERAGVGRVVWQVESDPYCRAVLARHWPDAVRYTDVRTARDLPSVDVVCGGFPCQDISVAGRGAGLDGARSGLWYEFARVVSDIRPRAVVVENVASGKGRWLSQVRGQLCDLGYRTRAIAISARDVGAPHRRERIFVLAHADGEPLRDGAKRKPRGRTRGVRGEGCSESSDACARLAHGHGCEREPPPRLHADGAQRDNASRWPPRRGDSVAWAAWDGPQPGVRGGADGVPAWLDVAAIGPDVATAAERLRALGNAVVPQCAEVIGRILMEVAA